MCRADAAARGPGRRLPAAAGRLQRAALVGRAGAALEWALRAAGLRVRRLSRAGDVAARAIVLGWPFSTRRWRSALATVPLALVAGVPICITAARVVTMRHGHYTRIASRRPRQLRPQSRARVPFNVPPRAAARRGRSQSSQPASERPPRARRRFQAAATEGGSRRARGSKPRAATYLPAARTAGNRAGAAQATGTAHERRAAAAAAAALGELPCWKATKCKLEGYDM